ncbi:MAG: hypothetical protein JJ858_05420 [Rhizobiaceae bacterium]|nr:hypothetical protein [Rhizobiaceae bacterium]
MKQFFLAALLLTSPNVAHADAIYGCWTNGTERLVVEFSKITSPSGASPQAQIDRHTAIFTAPESERDAGQTLVFRQLNDNEIARTIQGSTDSTNREIWNPCNLAIS